ncbi:cytoplasmic dynein 1 heavy chain 1-like isoform X4 [Convolutriloba macropyga]|uniref:cytoplasmic dynein 1 heavy chain 1-like isoform X4 n=1 Tax=Convolutriloba macropyga TaxID=536237 RepID=UPI003F51F517
MASAVEQAPTGALDPGGAPDEAVPSGPPAVEIAEVSTFQQYLRKILPIMLEDGAITASTNLEKSIDNTTHVDLFKKFMGEAATKSLLIRKCVLKDEDEGDASGNSAVPGSPSNSSPQQLSSAQVSYSVSIEIGFSPTVKQQLLASVLFLKRALVVEAEKSVASQLRVMTLDDPAATPYETLHNYVSNAVAPYFKSYIRATGKTDRDSDKLAPSVEKKLAELEMSLLHLQQNIEIPEVILQIHPTVLATIKKAKDEDRTAKVEDFGDLVEDSSFLNALQNGVNRWIREIQKVTKLDRDAGSGTAMQEISFWLNLEKAIQKIREKLDGIEVTLTLDILKQGRRYMALLSFDTDTGLGQAVTLVNDYNTLMKDFPLNELLAATELDKLKTALVSIFQHFKKMRSTKYPTQRCLRLIEAISRDLMNKLLNILGSQKLMHISHDEFERIIAACTEIFQTWDTEYDRLITALREQSKKKRDDSMKMVWRANPAHKKLQARLDQMRKFRKQHEQLRAVIVRVLRPTVRQPSASSASNAGGTGQDQPMNVVDLIDASDANAIDEVNLAYENVKEIDCLDVSNEGGTSWEAAKRRYDERIDRVETRITSKLRDQLGTAKNANEMFRIFSRFNALFVRPHIRGAIREYQTQLIQRVKDDIEHLHDKFKINYQSTRAVKVSVVGDIPPMSGSIIWANMIERQLVAYLGRVEAVLGKSWEQQLEGAKLKSTGDAFKTKLDTLPLFEEWARNSSQKIVQQQGRIFAVESFRVRNATKLRFKVNFDPEVISLYKEVRDLNAMGHRLPINVKNKSHQANQMYPFAVSLIESMQTYNRTCDKVDPVYSLSLLVAVLKRELHKLISEGCNLTWESYKLDHYVQKFSTMVFNFHEKAEDLVLIEDRVWKEVEKLGTCEYSSDVFSTILQKIQDAVDELNLASFSNLPFWVKIVEEKLEKKLVVRLEAGLKSWTEKLLAGLKESQGGRDDDNTEMEDTEPQQGYKLGGEPVIPPLVHEIRIINQVMQLSPCIEECRFQLIQALNAWEAHVLELPRIQTQRFQVGTEVQMVRRYTHLLDSMPNGYIHIVEAYKAIEKVVTAVESYTQTWLNFQALWDLSIDHVCMRVGNNLDVWMTLLFEIKSKRTTFDTSETRKEFGPIAVDFGKVQSKVNLKYDSVHKEILAKFGSIMSSEMSDVFSVLSKSRGELETHSVETASTSEAVSFITHVQALKRKMRGWDKQVETFKAGQKVLERQRFQFPQGWMYADQVDGEWVAFNEIMKRKDASIQSQIANLQMKIVAEDKVVEQKTVEVLAEWEKDKPVGGSMKPSEATVQLTILEGKFTKLKEERDNMNKAKEALELGEPGAKSALDEQLQIALEELTDLKGVWGELAGIWEQIELLKDQAWVSISPKKLRQSLEALIAQLKNMPARLRQYESYDHVQRVLKQYSKMNTLIVELKADYLKDRHWKILMKKLHVNWVMTDLTLGHVWDIDLGKFENDIREVLAVAQGENALEEFLKQVRNCWQHYELELINYQNRTKIIRGWDDLFGKVKEHINSVQAMKLSPYYKVFEEEASGWEDKLNRINALFDVWIDVQRRWVYLEGIFAGSADIKNLLPVETQRFQSISSEFLGLMKKVVRAPLVLDVLNIQGVQRQLEKLADLLNKIQKALGEYLERERASFPRFYFVGDEDLLEIIGNSKNVQRLQKHFKKMFAGVNTLMFNEDYTIVEGVASREAEQVVYKTKVSLIENPRINEWLTKTESEMKVSLAKFLADGVAGVQQFSTAEVIDQQKYMEWLDSYQAQLVVIAAQIAWTQNAENALKKIDGGVDLSPLEQVSGNVEKILNVLADSVLLEQPQLRRKKLEHMITELVHQRDVTRLMVSKKMNSSTMFEWLMQMRFYFDPKNSNPLKQLDIVMSNAHFNYGFEYLGVVDKLVQTPLTDRCYFTLTQALEGKYGGSPFGPAGTGKTESVKSLGNQLGRFVLVFNCDETFDFQAMGRIFVGLCQVGAWGCFDEFNRLEEKMLSAVSQQIQAIQETLKAMGSLTVKPDKPLTVELVGKTVSVNPDMAVFITMNPDYAGRSNLPDNLKKLFRAMAMTQPDKQLIAQVMLFSQGFRTAEVLSKKIVPLFRLCTEQLSNQSHYDFTLRALKAVLNCAGSIKRERMMKLREELEKEGQTVDPYAISEQINEQDVLIQCICETTIPKLVAEDIPLMRSLLADVFPGVEYSGSMMDDLRREIQKVCEEKFLACGMKEEDLGYVWTEKVLQLYQIMNLQHGLMLVGPSGSGKTCAWKTLMTALERFDGTEGVATLIDPKAITKKELYGSMDPNTREWTDGIFTATLRKVIDNVRGERNKRQWIIFDGDVDPEWVENLNSTLDDNKLLTLPNGERLAVPPNVRIMFEVQDLKHATLATVSRCGMIWFSEEVMTVEMVYHNFLQKLRNVSVEPDEEQQPGVSASGGVGSSGVGDRGSDSQDKDLSPAMQANKMSRRMAMQVQNDVASVLAPHFAEGGIVSRVLEQAASLDHIMEYTKLRVLSTLFSMLNQIARNVIKYNRDHPDFLLSREKMESYTGKALIYSLIFAAVGDGKLKAREQLGQFIAQATTIQLPNMQPNQSIIDFEATVEGEWVPWSNKVPQIEVETHKVGSPDVVVPTLDTVRHEALLYTWLSEHKPLVLCGPPGSGKTMTLFSALRALPDMEVIGLNFSSATTPELLIKTLDQYCEYKKTPNGTVIAPMQLGQWIVLFCDEINLPDQDKYETQRVITFLRQIVEHGGFYRTSDMQWVQCQRIQIVGACNPPTDPGRKPISPRLLRHIPVVYVDYPGEMSLKQIYGTFNRAMLRCISSLKPYHEPLTNAMVEFFLKTQERFTADMQPHYIYSPREMTRWVRGIYEAIKPLEILPVEGLVRIWAHEAFRLFRDRLIEDEERQWTDEHVEKVALSHFPGIDREEALKGPILFSNWLSKDYMPVEQEQLRDYVKARLKVFYEEELDVQLVLFNEVLDHVLRIDRVFRQPQGHLLLIGVSGAGKTTLSRFVAWMNGLTVYQIKVHNKYTGDDFDEDLRIVLRRSGCKGEKICFIMDEGNVLDASFLERMNTLLANGEVPGLFEGDEYTTLMTQIKEGAVREGLMLDSNEELYKWFTHQVMRNLHVVFTMNPSADGLKDRAATSPALFNRCVLNWFGDWSLSAYFQVGKEFTIKVDIDNNHYTAPQFNPPLAFETIPTPLSYHSAIVNSFVFIHQSLHRVSDKLTKRGGRPVVVTPRHYLDFISHYVKLSSEKRNDLEEQQQHLSVGLQKIRETVQQVEQLQKELKVKSKELEEKNALANAKLKQMVADQQAAESKKTEGEALQVKLKEMSEYISVKRNDVMHQLAAVEPAVEEAKQAVSSIKRQNLVEIRTMNNPPPPVKITLESVCLMLGEGAPSWRDIRQLINTADFIPRILNFDADQITDEIREQMSKKYLSNPDYTFEKINKASQACGPMVKWAIAQVSYAEMLRKVDPLRQELSSLETQAAENQKKADETNKLIADLEASIATYTAEYAQLISQAQSIKTDAELVEAKVTRSRALLGSLESEKVRWEAGSEAFKGQMATIVGDVILSSAFMAYAGYFDQSMRRVLVQAWTKQLSQSNIVFRPELALVEYLSSADDRLTWQANSLPADDLCVENAIMLKRYNRYPLVIDPSGQATEFITKEYRNKKITKTSFLDSNFRKHLESALRFGNPLLVQDVESYDPILNPVLNREVRRTGGRVLITIGDQDIDLSPTFAIFLSTRDPTVEFPPDLCSRVTFVNFTVTRSSLQSQCLNTVLKSERPDVDEKRSDLLKLQGEFRLKLRHLEKSLLNALNESKGSILEDDKVIGTLETLKKEAAEVQKKVEETDVIMAEVEATSQQYAPLATACSNVYFTLEALNQIHFLYQYSLRFFLELFHAALQGKGSSDDKNPLTGVNDPGQRLRIINKLLFALTFERVSRGMLHQDRLTFAVLLARIQMKGNPGLQAEIGDQGFDPEYRHFIEGNQKVVMASAPRVLPGLQVEQAERMTKLSSSLPAFKNIYNAVEASNEFSGWLNETYPELRVPSDMWQMPSGAKPLNKVGQSLYNLLLVEAFRPDRLLAAVNQFVASVMGEEFLNVIDSPLDLRRVVEEEVTSGTAVLMCSVTGFDASGKVEDLAADTGKQLTAISIGSAEGFKQADSAINMAAKSGRWVLLKNVHLAPQWLAGIEKKLHSLTPNNNFRLFLTCEITPKLPMNLVRAGRVFVFEPPPGIKANLMRTFAEIPASRITRAPNERSRLYVLLAWFHGIVQERLRYSPLGWSKKYEFTDSDLKCGCDLLDTWIDSTSKGRSNLPPEKIPWDAMRTTLAKCIYGGKIDNDFDQQLLNAFLSNLFTIKSFEADFALIDDSDGKGTPILMPDGLRHEQFVKWVGDLPDTQTPSWLGLPNNAETVLLTTLGTEMTTKLLKMRTLEDESEEDLTAGGGLDLLSGGPADNNASSAGGSQESNQQADDGRPAWMKQLAETASQWLSLVPKSLQVLQRNSENIKDPLFRFFDREISQGAALLEDVRRDLRDVVAVCNVEKKQTNYLRQLISFLSKGILPMSWNRYKVPKSVTVLQWIADFSERIKQLREISKVANDSPNTTAPLKGIHVWLGGLFTAEAYITATRQYVAQANQWSLEELTLQVKVYTDVHTKLDMCSFGILSLNLLGAACEDNKLSLSSKISTDLPLTALTWVKLPVEERGLLSEGQVRLPVYLNFTRAELLFTLDFHTVHSDGMKFYERGVALLCSKAV